MKSKLLSVTAACPTYGRFTRLKDAIACFLLQDYLGKKCLTILSDTPTPLRLLPNGDEELTVDDSTKIVLINAEERIPTLGQKRQMLAESASTDLIAHWEDDDLYLPWHFSTRISILQERPEIDCVKPNRAFLATKPPDKLNTCRVYLNVYDGGMIYRRGTAIDYPDVVRGVPLELIHCFHADGKLDLCRKMPEYDLTYVYRIKDNIRHLCRIGTKQTKAARVQKDFARKNNDYGEGEALLPDDGFIHWARKQMHNQFMRFADGLKRTTDKETADIMMQRILKTLDCSKETH